MLEVFLLTLFLRMGNSAAYFCSKLLKSGAEITGTVMGGAQNLNGEWDGRVIICGTNSRNGQIIRQMSTTNVEIYNL